MSNPLEHVALPESVEQKLAEICREQKLSPPSPQIRRELASISEERACDILHLISLVGVKSSLNGFIHHMIHSPKRFTLRSLHASLSSTNPQGTPNSNTPAFPLSSVSLEV